MDLGPDLEESLHEKRLVYQLQIESLGEKGTRRLQHVSLVLYAIFPESTVLGICLLK